MRHYFIDQGHTSSDYFDINVEFNGHNFCFTSCDDIFSKDELDTGTQVLISTFMANASLDHKAVLDMGCGYGAIGIILAYFNNNIQIDMCDINPLAVNLSNLNKQKLKLNNITSVFESDRYANVNKQYDYIITNPPIKAGKQTLLDILTGAKQHLKDGGQLYFVIRKDHGMQSAKDKLSTIYSSCQILKRHKGHYVLVCNK